MSFRAIAGHLESGNFSAPGEKLVRATLVWKTTKTCKDRKVHHSSDQISSQSC